MNYQFNKSIISNNTIKYTVNSESGKLTYRDFINILKVKDENFLRTFRDELNRASAEMSAYFWECVPVSSNTIDKEFEFVLVKSEALNSIRQDYSSFQEHFRKSSDNQAVSFLSFSGDTLIVPVPKGADYKNISKFTDNSRMEQWETLWQKVGEKMEENLINANGATRWLSTSGLGISYLHVRIDRRPKYYSHQEYLTETQQQQEIPPKNW
ncbi:MAG: hypothetical protein MRERV_1c166 [Mycoplasmataceae bacterium RV_VA103A]|nr:MAG: hypothetical protein MRERV_1c166 [Mycoplasmataceae bacterium RV_VA103A]